jgi:type IV pilus assembly protein PilA
MRARISANEASAVGSLRAINTACANFSSTYGGAYPTALSDLGPSSAPTSTAADLLDSVISSGIKSGYTFSYTPVAAGAGGLITSYSVVAVPVTTGVTGQRGFYTDQTFVIRANATGVASSSDSPIG